MTVRNAPSVQPSTNSVKTKTVTVSVPDMGIRAVRTQVIIQATVGGRLVHSPLGGVDGTTSAHRTTGVGGMIIHNRPITPILFLRLK